QGVALDFAVSAGGLGQARVERGLLGLRLAGVGQLAAAEDLAGLGAVVGLGQLAVDADLVDVAFAVLAGGFVEGRVVLRRADEAAVLHGAAVVGGGRVLVHHGQARGLVRQDALNVGLGVVVQQAVLRLSRLGRIERRAGH